MLKRLLAFVLCLSLIASFAPDTMTAQAGINRSKMLMVSGNRLIWESDHSVVVRLTGLNIPGAEWTNTPEKEMLDRSTKEALERWNSNTIRIPVKASSWISTTTTGKAYRAYIDKLITMISDAGKYAILDLHEYKQFDNPNYISFWQQAAVTYGNNPAVLFGILNEPHDITWEVWRNGDGSDIKGHQQIVELIRDTGAKNIIIAGGLDWGYDLRGIVGKAPDDTKVYALIDQGSGNDLSKAGNGIMYDAHIYPWKGGRSNWDSKVGEVRKLYPVLIGENGFDPADGTQMEHAPNAKHEEWVPPLFEWMNDYETFGNLANWTGWCFHPRSSPRIISDAADDWSKDNCSYTPTSFWGVYVKNQLRADLGTDVIKGMPATYSESAMYPGENALDDDYSTAWRCTATGDRYLLVDMESERKINRWVVRHNSSTALYKDESASGELNTRDFSLQVSDDGENWITVDELKDNASGVTDRFFKPVTARYVRLYITKPAKTGKNSVIYQFSVYQESVAAERIKKPTANISGGYVTKGTLIHLQTDSKGATIRYTTDGTEPTEMSNEYIQQPIEVNGDMTIKALVMKKGVTSSEVATFVYLVPILTGISVEGQKTVYSVGDTFDYTAGKVVAEYTHNVTNKLPFSNENVIIDGFNADIINKYQMINVEYMGMKSQYAIIIRDSTFQGDHELSRNMNTERPTIWKELNGTSAVYTAGEAENGVDAALKITGGTAGGGCQLAFNSSAFGNGDYTHTDQYVTSGFIGASYMILRVKSTKDFDIRFSLEYQGQSPAEVRHSAPFTVSTTGGAWKNVVVPFKDLEDPDDPWIYNMKGTARPYNPIILLSMEGMDFGTESYAVIGNIRILWFNTPIAQKQVTYVTNGGTSVETDMVYPFAKLEAPSTVKDGYVLIGWYIDETRQNKWNFATGQVEEDITLYAEWIEAEDWVLCVVSNTVSTLEQGEISITGEVCAMLTSYNEEQLVTIWLAVYDEQGIMIYCAADSKPLKQGDSKVVFTGCTIETQADKNYSAYIMVFNDLQQPITEKEAVIIDYRRES